MFNGSDSPVAVVCVVEVVDRAAEAAGDAVVAEEVVAAVVDGAVEEVVVEVAAEEISFYLH